MTQFLIGMFLGIVITSSAFTTYFQIHIKQIIWNFKEIKRAGAVQSLQIAKKSIFQNGTYDKLSEFEKLLLKPLDDIKLLNLENDSLNTSLYLYNSMMLTVVDHFCVLSVTQKSRPELVSGNLNCVTISESEDMK